jgi:hypothetical protein
MRACAPVRPFLAEPALLAATATRAPPAEASNLHVSVRSPTPSIQRGTSDLDRPLAQAAENGGRQSPRAYNKQDQGNKQQDIHDPRFN